MQSKEKLELCELLNIKDENIIHVCRDCNNQVIKIIFNDLIIIEEFESHINKKFLMSIPIIKKLEKESFEYSSIIDFVFSLKMFLQSFSKKCEIKNSNFISKKINHKLHL